MIKILDCTLRDGGYNNNWEFGENNILKIYNSLIESGIDIIECGFLTKKLKCTKEQSLFDSVKRISEVFKPTNNNNLSVCMINYGEYDLKDLANRLETDIHGLRIAFHRRDRVSALEYCKGIVQKGYKLFMQPMVSMAYSDEEFLELIRITNEIKPYAFYIVDSFGVMKKSDLMRFFYMTDNNLDKSISIGFHSHNNLQLSYSHAQTLVDLQSDREIIIDSSVMGMGRGAGNLNTELFIQYLNEKAGRSMDSAPLLDIVDEVLTPIYHHNYWGYSLPHYLSAVHGCHPNYATFLDDKNTLKVSDIKNILSLIPEDRKVRFNKDYTEELYIKYQSSKELRTNSFSCLKENLADKDILIIAPGNSIKKEENKIKDFILKNQNLVSIAVNFIPRKFNCDYLFVSNLKRYEQIKSKEHDNLILTSNIPEYPDKALLVNYADLINNTEYVEDNAGLMLIKLLIKIGISNIYLAGFDGYSLGVYDDYTQKDLAFIKNKETVQLKNENMSHVLRLYKNQINITYLTKEHHVKI